MTDATGLHRTIVQSFTTFDVETGYVSQERTWIVLGRAAKALAALARIHPGPRS